MKSAAPRGFRSGSPAVRLGSDSPAHTAFVRLPSDRFVIVSLAATASFVVIALGLIVSVLDGLDKHLVGVAHRWAVRHPDAVGFWRVMSEVGQPATWEILAAAVAFLLWSRGKGGVAVRLVVGVAGAQAISSTAKLLVGRPRPMLPHPLADAAGYSFPSGHALISAAATLLALQLARPYVTRPRWAALCVIGALVVGAIGFSRVALGVHYPTDIIGGWALATMWVIALEGSRRQRQPTAQASRLTPASRLPRDHRAGEAPLRARGDGQANFS